MKSYKTNEELHRGFKDYGMINHFFIGYIDLMENFRVFLEQRHKKPSKTPGYFYYEARRDQSFGIFIHPPYITNNMGFDFYNRVIEILCDEYANEEYLFALYDVVPVLSNDKEFLRLEFLNSSPKPRLTQKMKACDVRDYNSQMINAFEVTGRSSMYLLHQFIDIEIFIG